LCVLSFIAIFSTGTGFAQDIRATTDDGRKVLLKEDGSWKFHDASKLSRSKTSALYQKPEESTALFKAKGDKFMLWFDPVKWHQKKRADTDKTTFVHKDGDVYAMVLAERFGMTLEALKDIAVKNAQNASPDVKVTYEKNRIVNGKTILCMKMEGTIEGVQFIYYGYYYADKAGIVQLITYTSQNLFPEYESEMTKFLNGLVVND
jgi:hypothetical protein